MHSRRTGPRPAPDRDNRHNQRKPRGPVESSEIPTDADLVTVQFKGHRKGYYHNKRNVEIATGDYCMVEADRGRDMGRVCYIGPGKSKWWRQAARQGVIGQADPGDLKRMHENRADEWEYYDICLEKIQQRKLRMNLVTVERQFDRNKITFYFTAEKRVDFRKLVKDLASIFRTRIELRQIGVRDEAKMKGGLGICGRELCCCTFLHDFSPVTLKMAKGQQLPLSPNKLSGLCGRLRCCLAYEYDVYQRALARLPRVGTRVDSAQGRGVVRKLDLLHEMVTVYLEAVGEKVVLAPDQLTWENRKDLPKGRSRSGHRGCRHEPGNHN